MHMFGVSGADRQVLPLIQRLEEATVLRQYLNTLPLEKHFIVAGDFNIY